ncbi:MAG TPA: CpsB/CapC family capsule biosynthesis tyrosine phosphatase [Gaiellaceae bacterium]|nr:CpsB/CapC family capsule biosynthesis tyrosine phosphatase [Gaiellaceae bacterium]
MGFVDVHSHVVPSGDDGAGTVREALELCWSAAERGTSVLFATPHVWPQLPLTIAREGEIRRAYERMKRERGLPLELRLGFELTPTRALLDEDPRRYELEGTGAVLMEVPFTGPAATLVRLGEHAEAAGLLPVIAHPERTQSVQDRPALAAELAERGWLLQVNASSLTGDHGPDADELGWHLIEQGLVALVASDGHRPTRPPHLDAAYAEAIRKVGEERARELFCGAALGFSAPAPSLAARPAA